MNFSKWFRGSPPSDKNVKLADSGLNGILDDLVRQQLTPKRNRTITDATGQTINLDERHPLDPRNP